MTTNNTQPTCFNCERTDDEIPVVEWSYRKRPLSVCSACIPILIHKWEQVVTMLDTQPEENDNE